MKDPWARGQGDHNSREKKGGGKGRGRLKGKLREFSGLMDLSSVFFSAIHLLFTIIVVVVVGTGNLAFALCTHNLQETTTQQANKQRIVTEICC